MTEPLVVALALERVATRVSLWQGGAQRFTQRLPHGELALTAGRPLDPAVRRGLRFEAARHALAAYGEDALRPDAFVVLGSGAPRAGVYAAEVAAEGEADDAVALALALGSAADTVALAVEPLGEADVEVAADAEGALLARAAARRHARARPGSEQAARVVVAVEPSPRAYALQGETIVASMPGIVRLEDAGHAVRLIRRSEQGDPAAADGLARFTEALREAALSAGRTLQDVLVVMLTGTLATHGLLADEIARGLRSLAPAQLLPGARVERALADAATEVLLGRAPVHRYA